MRTAAVLPVKRFTLAKQRLGESVEDGLRLDLARAMVGDVLDALARTRSIERTIVVTNEESIAGTAHGLGATVIPDTAESGQSAAVALGIALAASEGIERVLCVPGDCPALDPSELDALLSDPVDQPGGGGLVVIVPDRHGTGTNGLLLTPPTAIASELRSGELLPPRGSRARRGIRVQVGAPVLAAAGHRHRGGPRRSARAARPGAGRSPADPRGAGSRRVLRGRGERVGVRHER